jgi:phosphate transport system substrate-binding protein
MNRLVYPSLVAAACSVAACVSHPPVNREIRLSGAGSTFAYPLYSRWADAFGKLHPEVEVDYEPIGSGGGIGLVTDGKMDFGATDGPMSDTQIKTFEQQRECQVLHLPMALGADVPTYNLPGVTGELRFTPRALAGVFLGTIDKWNHPEIARANPEVALPDERIIVVHRSDSSGTTYVWADYLSKVDAGWRTRVGRGTSVNWPVGIGVSGNQAVTEFVAATPHSIGYVELTYAIRAKLRYGQVQNRAGQFVKAELWTVTAAASESVRAMPDDFRMSITDPPGENAYPISTFTWILVPSKIGDAAKRQAVVSFLNWGLTDGQAFADGLSYSRLPDAVVKRTQEAISRIQ